MHCFQWGILYRWSCESLVMKATLVVRRCLTLAFYRSFVTNDQHDHKHPIGSITLWEVHSIFCLQPTYLAQNILLDAMHFGKVTLSSLPPLIL